MESHKSEEELKSHTLEEALEKERKLVMNLIQEVDYKNQQLSKMEHNRSEVLATVCRLVNGLTAQINSKNSSLLELELKYNKTVTHLMDVNAKLREKYNAEIRKAHSENAKLNNEFEQRTKELRDHKSESDLEWRSLQNEIELLKGRLQCENSIRIVNKSDAQFTTLRKELEEKSDRVQHLESLNNALTIKELMSNQELQDARKESVNSLRDMLNNRTTLEIKRMGEIDHQAFLHACLLKFPNGDYEEISAKLCSEWENYVGDPLWHPFKIITDGGILTEIIDENDEKLKELRNVYGDVAYEAVTNALLEMNLYNPSGRFVVPEVWNSKEGRRATLKEIIQYLIKQLKIHKRKRDLI